MFLNIQIDLIILETYDQQFTLTTKKSLHIIFKALKETQSTDHNQEKITHSPHPVFIQHWTAEVNSSTSFMLAR